MFLAIINDTFSEVKAELAANKVDQMVEEYFKKGYSNMVLKMSGQGSTKSQSIMEALKSAYNDEEVVTYAEIRQNLKKYEKYPFNFQSSLIKTSLQIRCNFSDLEIEMFISQYDANENEEIDASEAKDVFKDIASNKPIIGVNAKFKLTKSKRLPMPTKLDYEK